MSTEAGFVWVLAPIAILYILWGIGTLFTGLMDELLYRSKRKREERAEAARAAKAKALEEKYKDQVYTGYYRGYDLWEGRWRD